MAGRTKGGGNAEKTDENVPTPRVVFKRERVIVIPEGVEKVDADKLHEAFGVPKSVKVVTSDEAWIEVARADGSQDQAIRAYAGEPNTPDAKPGAYRTMPARSWKGGKVYTKPPEPKVEVEELI